MSALGKLGSRASYCRYFVKSKLLALAYRATGKKFYSKVIGQERVLSSEEGGGQISAGIESGLPFVAGRIGTTELIALNQAMEIRLGLRREFSKSACEGLKTFSGVFPASQASLLRFSNLMFDGLHEVDLLAQLGRMDYVKEVWGHQAKVAELRCLEPYYHENPWSRSLASKKVLVVHPFASTIESQYKKRASLFVNDTVLPEFDLQTFTPVQSFASATVPYDTWFDALDEMAREISKLDFDIAIIGAGAYGLPLAIRVKQMGRVAIHVGGATQILFGIKGKRWDNHRVVSRLYNNHWVRPSEAEKPEGFQRVEGGCYW